MEYLQNPIYASAIAAIVTALIITIKIKFVDNEYLDQAQLFKKFILPVIFVATIVGFFVYMSNGSYGNDGLLTSSYEEF